MAVSIFTSIDQPQSRRWVWLPASVLLALMLILRFLDLRGSFDPPWLLFTCNLLFASISSSVILLLVARSFMDTGAAGLLHLGSGITCWGLAGALAASVGGSNFNASLTIHNLCVWLAALYHLFSVVFRPPAVPIGHRPAWLAVTVGLAVVLSSLVSAAAALGWTPLFFVQGQGGTFIRTIVLASAAAMLAVSAGILLGRGRGAPSTFSDWYAGALLLIAASALGLMIQKSHGSVLGWTARATGWLSSLYLIMASIAVLRESSVRKISLAEVPRDARLRYALAVFFVITGVVLRLVFLDLLGTSAVMITFFPAVILASLYGGRGAGILATALSVLAVNLLWRAPFGIFHAWDAAGWLIIFLFVLTSISISLIVDALIKGQKVQAERRLAQQTLIESTRAQRLLATIGEISASHLDFESLVGTISEAVATELSVSRCGISTVDSAAGKIVVENDHHGGFPSRAGIYPLSEYAFKDERKAGEPIIIGDIATDPRTAESYTRLFQPAQVRAFISVPLHREGPWAEDFWVSHHEPRAWSSADIALMAIVAGRISLVLRQARTSRELRTERERLSQALEELGRAKDAADIALKAKDNFLAALSHELRTPLTPVLMIVSSLMEDRSLPDDVRDQLRIVTRNVKLETHLIDDLLDLTRIARGKVVLRKELCDVHVLLNHAVDLVRTAAMEKNLRLSFQPTASKALLLGDPTRVQQVFWNLLGNAVKFTSPGGSIIVRTSNPEPANGVRGVIRIEVCDDGIGLSPAAANLIFEPFQQAANGKDRNEGLGLGLAIAKAVVALHDGAIRAESEGEGHGTAFIVELPLPPTEE